MDGKAKTIVIVENQPLMLALLSKSAEIAGMTVLAELGDSKNAAKTALKLPPDLILFSISIPSQGDLVQISTLRRYLHDTRILALVTGEFHGQEQAALDYGAHKVLTKAISRWELIEALKNMSTNFHYQSA